MNIEKLFKKAEKFFILEKSDKVKKKSKREKLESSFLKKIAVLKKKIKKAGSSDGKMVLKKQLGVLKEFLEKLEE